ncbi:MAG: glycosyltransferase family 39 protein [Crinalium sp.]
MKVKISITDDNQKLNQLQIQLLLLLLWVVIGGILRFTQLTDKSPWTDEFVTMVFSLGNSFKTVPLDSAIALDTLMQPLQPNSSASIGDVVNVLLAEDHHPPLYFVLAHLWMQLFPPQGGLISLWGARSLPALFGVASIIGVYFLGIAAFRSRLIGQIAAAIMAVSPYGIFLAQEARHYTLGILWVIASLCCLVIAAQNLRPLAKVQITPLYPPDVLGEIGSLPLTRGGLGWGQRYLCKRSLQQRKTIPSWLVLSWIIINSLGLATHYFFVITLCAEPIVLIVLAWWNKVKQSDISVKKINIFSSEWRRIYIVAAGTFAGGLVWLLVWQNTYKSEMTQWVESGDRNFLQWINPIFQSIAAWITMICLLPVEATYLPVVIASGVAMLIFFLWALPILYRGLKTQLQQPSTSLGIRVLGVFVLGAIALFFVISYGLGFDITRGARYNFVYFPAVIVLVGASLAVSWEKISPHNSTRELNFPLSSLSITTGKKAVAIIWLIGLLSAVTVVTNLGYRKYYRPDIIVPIIQQTSSVPVLIATTHNTIVQTGEMMGIGWEIKKITNSGKPINAQFLLAHQNQNRCEGKECRASDILKQTLPQLPQPVDLWLMNFHAPVDLKAQNCLADTRSFPPVYGYDYKLYHCHSNTELPS